MQNQKIAWGPIITTAVAILTLTLTVSSRLFATTSEVSSLQTSQTVDEKRLDVLEAQLRSVNDGVVTANAKLDLLTKRATP